MEIYLAQPRNELRDRFFPQHLLDQLESAGRLRLNETGRVLNGDELAQGIGSADIAIIISWAGGQLFTDEVVSKCPNLKLIINPCGSVATTMTDAVYQRGITVCSANAVMARYVAEATLAYALQMLRDISAIDAAVHRGEYSGGNWSRGDVGTLIGASVGLVGLGTVGRCLLDFLAPFNVNVRVFDPYLSEDALTRWPFAHASTLEDTLRQSDIVSVHASQTPETYRLLSSERLAMLRDGAMLINTARGSIIDEAALAAELAKPNRRLHATLDVYETEPLPADSPLRSLPNVTLQPHLAGAVSVHHYTRAMVEEVERFTRGEPLQYAIPYEQFTRMTR